MLHKFKKNCSSVWASRLFKSPKVSAVRVDTLRRSTLVKWQNYSLQWVKNRIGLDSTSRWSRVITSELVEHGKYVRLALSKYYNVSNTHIFKLQLEFFRWDGLCLLDSLWGAIHTTRHTCKAKQAVVSSKSCLVTMVFGNFDLDISTAYVQCRKYCSVTWGVDIFAHVPYRVQIPDRHWIPSPVTDGEDKWAIISRDEQNHGNQFRVVVYHTVHDEHLSISCFSKSIAFRPARYRTTWLHELSASSRWIRCFTAWIELKWPC